MADTININSVAAISEPSETTNIFISENDTLRKISVKSLLASRDRAVSDQAALIAEHAEAISDHTDKIAQNTETISSQADVIEQHAASIAENKEAIQALSDDNSSGVHISDEAPADESVDVWIDTAEPVLKYKDEAGDWIEVGSTSEVTVEGSGIHISDTEPTDENVSVWIDTDEDSDASSDSGSGIFVSHAEPTDPTVDFWLDMNDSSTPAYDIYSTEEQVVGRWIDGKLLYRKVFVATNVASGDGYIANTKISNISDIVALNTVSRVGANFIPNTWLLPSNPSNFYLTVQYDANEGIYLRAYTGVTKIVITVEYTKTTD